MLLEIILAQPGCNNAEYWIRHPGSFTGRPDEKKTKCSFAFASTKGQISTLFLFCFTCRTAYLYAATYKGN
jgi:hypothetical protein